MKRFGWVTTLAACTLAATSVNAQLITFETTPAGVVPLDNQLLNAPYPLTGGGTVAFYFDVNLNNAFDAGIDALPVFERTGPDGSDAFTGFVSVSDAPNPADAPQLGGWFLRQLQPGPAPPPFIVDYNTLQTVTGLSGEIWDIDGNPTLGTEQWDVDVLDVGGSVLATQTSPLGNGPALDAKAWTFAFSALPPGVDKVRLTFIGSKTNGIGLAFNNFSPMFPVPEPGAAAIAALALAFGIGRQTRGRRKS